MEIIESSELELSLFKNVPTITIEKSRDCQIRFEGDLEPAEKFQIITGDSHSISVFEKGERYLIPAAEEGTQLITRKLEGSWVTEKVIRENGYQTTERERNAHLEKEKRDEELLSLFSFLILSLPFIIKENLT